MSFKHCNQAHSSRVSSCTSPPGVPLPQRRARQVTQAQRGGPREAVRHAPVPVPGGEGAAGAGGGAVPRRRRLRLPRVRSNCHLA